MQSDQKHWGIERLETLGNRAIRNTGGSSDQKYWGINRSETLGDREDAGQVAQCVQPLFVCLCVCVCVLGGGFGWCAWCAAPVGCKVMQGTVLRAANMFVRLNRAVPR